MKKTMFVSVLAIVLFTSFTTAKELALVPNKKSLSAPAVPSFSAKGSYTWNDVTGFVCNGDEIYFPSLTVSYDYHGVYSNQVYMIQGTDRLYGTGTSINTTEKFVADFTTRYNEKYPGVNGAVVIRQKTNNSFKGDQGTVDAFSFTLHLTFDAKGVLDAEKSSIEMVCQ